MSKLVYTDRSEQNSSENAQLIRASDSPMNTNTSNNQFWKGLQIDAEEHIFIEMLFH